MARTTYDKDTNYQALINQAIQSGNAGLARQYEAQRNAKIADMNTQGKNIGGYQQTNYYQPLNLPEYKPYSGTTPTLNMPEYKPFSYKDFNYNAKNDDIYKQYAEQFARQGQSAGERSLAGAAAATGGMPSSFAAAANAQAQQAYAKKTADIIPVLEQNAYNRYLGERNFNYQDYMNQHNADVDRAKSMYDADWQSTNFNYQDYLNQYNAGVDRTRAAYDSEIGQRDFNYQNYLNKLDSDYRQSEFDWRKDIDVRDFNYGAGQDAIRNSISWANHNLSQSKFDYGKEQDELARQYEESERLKQDIINSPEVYPNTPYGQEKYIADKEANALEDGIIRDFIAEAFKAEDTNRYLGENLKDLSPSQAEAVVAYFESLKKAKY